MKKKFLLALSSVSRKTLVQAVSVLGLGLSLTAQAAVSKEEAQRLDADLTPLGAERAGNKSETIPACTGGIVKPPAEYKAGMFNPDPFADDKILLTITAENMDQYDERLNQDQKTLQIKYDEG